MHALKPELDGKDLTDNKDPNGVRLFVLMSEVCRTRGEGFVEYWWAKPGKAAPQPKVSFVKRYGKWDWIVGAGTYVDDIEAAVAEARNTILPVYAAVGAFVLLIGWPSVDHWPVRSTPRRTLPSDWRPATSASGSTSTPKTNSARSCRRFARCRRRSGNARRQQTRSLAATCASLSPSTRTLTRSARR
jgi:hypothetical protein